MGYRLLALAAVLAAVMMITSCSTSTGIIGGADGPTAVYTAK